MATFLLLRILGWHNSAMKSLLTEAGLNSHRLYLKQDISVQHNLLLRKFCVNQELS